MTKYIKTLFFASILILLVPSISFATFSVGWNATSTATPWISPNLVNGVIQTVVANNFTATSTTATSTFPIASSTNLYGQNITVGSQKGCNTASALSTDSNGLITCNSSIVGSQWTLSGSNLYPNSTSYYVGIGTTNPTHLLELSSANYWTVGGGIQTAGLYSTGGVYSANLYTTPAASDLSLNLRDNSYKINFKDSGGNSLMTILGTGNVGIGTTSPTAVLHLKASTATANTASLKIDAGVVATVAVSGNIESDGTHLYWTSSTPTRYQLDQQSAASGITIGTSVITSGTTTRVLYDNAGVIGEYIVSGSGNVAMTTNPVFTTPNLGTPSALVLTSATGLPAAAVLAGTLGTGAYVMDTKLTVPQVINTNNAITASGNAATVPVTSKTNTVTNNSAATLTITILDPEKFLAYSRAPTCKP